VTSDWFGSPESRRDDCLYPRLVPKHLIFSGAGSKHFPGTEHEF